MSDFLPFSRPSMGDAELAALREVLQSGWITTGPKNQALEEAFCTLTGNRHAVAVSSATGGMHVTLMALGIGPGDEVITPSQTWVSTLNMICLLGATPVMIDVDRDNLMITAESVAAAITPNTKAIIPVHYAGAPADIEEFCFIHCHGELKGELRPGSQLELGETSYPVTAVGDVAEQNLRELGHITLRFDGQTEAEYPGTVHVAGTVPEAVHAGCVFKFVA